MKNKLENWELQQKKKRYFTQKKKVRQRILGTKKSLLSLLDIRDPVSK